MKYEKSFWHHDVVIIFTHNDCWTEVKVVEVTGSCGGKTCYGDGMFFTPEEADPWFTGTVKWDGCSNWDFQPDGVLFHFCGEADIKAFADILVFIQQKAPDHMKGAVREYFS